MEALFTGNTLHNKKCIDSQAHCVKHNLVPEKYQTNPAALLKHINQRNWVIEKLKEVQIQACVFNSGGNL